MVLVAFPNGKLPPCKRLSSFFEGLGGWIVFSLIIWLCAVLLENLLWEKKSVTVLTDTGTPRKKYEYVERFPWISRALTILVIILILISAVLFNGWHGHKMGSAFWCSEDPVVQKNGKASTLRSGNSQIAEISRRIKAAERAEKAVNAARAADTAAAQKKLTS